MKKPYRRMTYTDRLIIEKLFNSGCSYRAIAKRLGFAVSSIHYEIKRGLYARRDPDTWNDIPRYSATIADDDAKWQATAKGGILKLDKNFTYAEIVADRIKEGQAPDRIVGDLRRKGEWTVSTPTLYRYIDHGFIPGISNKNLIQKPRKKQRTIRPVRISKPPRGESIDNRPAIIADRATPGHWEMDSVIGHRGGTGQSLLVLTERLTRYEIIVKLANKTALAVERALTKTVSAYPPGTFRTITVDNGTEFSSYEALKTCAEEIYYCHPYSSWERGSNENANRLIRRFFPKGQSLEHRTQKDCDAVAYYMNHMHRKILGYATAAELFEAWQETLVQKNLTKVFERT